MKKVMIMLAVFFTLSFAGFGGSFCDGWEEGYEAGYCYQNFACIAPIAPLCPLPHLGEDGYQDGYNRGFVAGLKAKK
jgi:hypothetical protein